MPTIGLVAGETSGDMLGSGLIEAIRRRRSDVRFEGVAGPLMREAGCEAWHDAAELSVMGLSEVISHLPRLLKLRRSLARRWTHRPPDLFVGIDSPDFNLGLEMRLRRRGIRTVHYVSPTVWIWRPRRVKKVAKAADRVLCILPFEAAFYTRHGVSAVFVGHPMADQIPDTVSRAEARRALGLAENGTVVAMLPGSRHTEVSALGADFAGAAGWLNEHASGMEFVAPMASQELERMFRDLVASHAPKASVTYVAGQARTCIAAADVVLLASGTASLEAALLKRPMVVAYKLARTTQWMLQAAGLSRANYFSLPNILENRRLVPELFQADVSPENLGRFVMQELARGTTDPGLIETFHTLHRSLRQNANERAADAVLELLNDG